MTYVDELAQFAVSLELAHVPEPVRHHAVKVFRDTIGVIVGGSALPEIAALAQQAPLLGPGESSVIIGQSQRASAPYAAFVNGTAGVSLELDEGNQFAINHPAIHLLPAALAYAESIRASGAELLAALIAGYEVAVRVGRATRPRPGVHPFGTHAILGATAAIGRLQRLSARELAAAFRVAAGLVVASSQSAATDGATVRNVYTGMTNMAGMMAPFLATSGITGERDGLAITFGTLVGAEFRPERVGGDLGEQWFITKNYFKLQACSRWNHAAVEAVEQLLAASPFTAEEVEHITVATYDPAIRLSGTNPPNWFAAKHSIPYNVAAMICFGSTGHDVHTPERVQDPVVRRVASKVAVCEDRSLTALTPDIRAARVTVTLRDGRQLQQYVDRPRGGFDNPYRDDELEAKFAQLVGGVFGQDNVFSLQHMCDNIHTMADVRTLTSALAK